MVIYLLYDILLVMAILVVLPYFFWRGLRRGKLREGIAERFGRVSPAKLSKLKGAKTIWVHAVSVGETIAAKPLLQALKQQYPTHRIVLSQVTETGRSVAEKLAEVDLCLYFPFDYAFVVQRVLRAVDPDLIIIVETEIWPNFLRVARRLGIPVVLVNGRISDRSFPRYLRLRWLFRRVLADITALCMQTDEDARRIVAIGAAPAKVHVTRNLKYDIPVKPVLPERKLALRERYLLPAGILVVTAGSTHQGEEELVLSAYQELLAKGRELLLVLVPRHPERAGAVAELLRRAGLSVTLRSALASRAGLFGAGEVLLVDTVGELMDIYAASDLVFVGGSLVPVGGHNILEPASLRLPVVYGPHMSNFRESAALLGACGGGIQLENERELPAVLDSLLQDPGERAAIGNNGARLLEENSGATARQMTIVAQFLGTGR